MGLISNSIFCSVGLVISSAFFKDSKSEIICHLFYTSEKILAREAIPRMLKINFYQANALPSELAGPGITKNGNCNNFNISIFAIHFVNF